MILTVFRSRLNKGVQDVYYQLVSKIIAIAESMPGFVSRKSFVAEDGERLSLVEFADEEAQRIGLSTPITPQRKSGARALLFGVYRASLRDDQRIKICGTPRQLKEFDTFQFRGVSTCNFF